MLREGAAIGAIGVTRSEVGAFADDKIALLQTFADQAVIAVENVRLFKELEARNRDVTEALEQQTATGEILRVISRAQTDVQPVFDAIADQRDAGCAAQRRASWCSIDGALMHLASFENLDPAVGDALRRMYPMPVGGDETIAGRVIRSGRVERSSTSSRIRSTATRASSGARATAASSPCRCSGTATRSACSWSGDPAGPVLRQADRAAPDLRRPGGDRDRERAPVHGAGGAQS